ncbi:MAG: nuclear transport factor 2 family protein [Acidimicrobiia bacterium]
MHETIAAAYQRWSDGDVEGFLALFPEDAVFVVPGRTRVSGQHDKASFRGVLEHVVAVTRAGRYRSELVTSYDAEGGSMYVFDNVVIVDGVEKTYHSVHEWTLRDGTPCVWTLYIREYDLFSQVWA